MDVVAGFNIGIEERLHLSLSITMAVVKQRKRIIMSKEVKEIAEEALKEMEHNELYGGNPMMIFTLAKALHKMKDEDGKR